MVPKIVVLDGYTLAPDQGITPPTAPNATPGAALETIDWSTLRTLGDLTVYDRSTEAQAIERAADAAIVITNKTLLSAQTIAALPRLRYIGVSATGVNIVDLAAARSHDVVVTNAPAYSTDSVAQHTFALILELVNHVGAHDHAVRDGQWSRCPDFSFTVAPITELAGKTLGIVGLGAIGQRVAQIAAAMGMKIAAAHQSSMGRVSLPNIDIDWLPLDSLVATADVITLHCPLTDQTRHVINADRLAMTKPCAILINTARGALVDEQALARALRDGQIAAAGLDVLDAEPPPVDSPLLHAPRCVVTPHVAWASSALRQRLMNLITDNVKAFLDGCPVNVVN